VVGVAVGLEGVRRVLEVAEQTARVAGGRDVVVEVGDERDLVADLLMAPAVGEFEDPLFADGVDPSVSVPVASSSVASSIERRSPSRAFASAFSNDWSVAGSAKPKSSSRSAASRSVASGSRAGFIACVSPSHE